MSPDVSRADLSTVGIIEELIEPGEAILGRTEVIAILGVLVIDTGDLVRIDAIGGEIDAGSFVGGVVIDLVGAIAAEKVGRGAGAVWGTEVIQVDTDFSRCCVGSFGEGGKRGDGYESQGEESGEHF